MTTRQAASGVNVPNLSEAGSDIGDAIAAKTTQAAVRTDIGARFQVGGSQPGDTTIVWLRPA